jgi:hypothetical protein
VPGHSLTTDHAATLPQPGDEVALDQDRRAIRQADQSQAGILRGQSTLDAVGGPLNRAQHPLGLRLVQEEQRKPNVVRVGIEQVSAIIHLDLAHGSDRTLANQVARCKPGGVVRPLVGDHELHAVAFARSQHRIRFAEVHGHGFLAQNGFGTPRRRGDHHLSVLLVPRARVDETGVFRVQHLTEVGVAFVF